MALFAEDRNFITIQNNSRLIYTAAKKFQINGSEQKLIFAKISLLCLQIHQAVLSIHYRRSD